MTRLRSPLGLRAFLALAPHAPRPATTWRRAILPVVRRRTSTLALLAGAGVFAPSFQDGARARGTGPPDVPAGTDRCECCCESRRGGGGPAPSQELGPEDRRVLLEAIDDEQHAWALYDRVIRDHGPQRPFLPIREAEARHVAALRILFERYDVPVPENPWIGEVPGFATLREACAAAVEAEIANAELLRELAARTSRPDVLAVLGNLRRASERHLEAFRRCVGRRPPGDAPRGRCGGDFSAGGAPGIRESSPLRGTGPEAFRGRSARGRCRAATERR